MRRPSVRFAHLRRGRADEPPGIVGVARVDLRTKVLVRRLNPGDIAIIDHADLDRVSADELIACKVAAVVNAAKSITGRYPNLGPQLLIDAGIPLVDDAGSDVLARVADGAEVRLDGEVLYAGDQVVAKGVLQSRGTLDAAMAEATAGVTGQIDSFAENTLEFLRGEHDLLTNGVPVPQLATAMKGKHVLVVVRGYRYREDLRTLRPYIREYRPVMMAVDGGADALLDAGYRPQVIIGDMDSISDEALCSGAELVVHAYPDGRAPGLARVTSLGLQAVPLPAPGTSEDVALLLADACGASLIAVVGTHWTLEEFLDKGRPGMASTFLTHLRVGGKLVNAKGVHQLYQSRISGWALIVLVLAAAFTIAIAVAFSPAGPILGDYFGATWHNFLYWFTGLFK
ncbi:putative cytokinetic ring protein SteA [Trebonia sp.]|uniref:putative cytokinetic ring protein SteA n=1 Tax=Trebonia sp. TaxID=2767075 RepID=UPI00261D5478|nr:putative cytokinetic ring protein SteA [Trebonia sp.]